jgi:GTP cyclohydrolase II
MIMERSYLRHVGSEAELRSKQWGKLRFESVAFTDSVDGDLVIRVGAPEAEPTPLVRIHSICTFSEVFGSDFCDCKEQLDMAMDAMVAAGSGIFVYLRMEGRGAGLCAKVAATALEVAGIDTYESRLRVGVEPDNRSYRQVGKYLKSRGVHSVVLLTKNPTKVSNLETEGIVVKRQSLRIEPQNEAVASLYRVKAQKFNHYTSGMDED